MISITQLLSRWSGPQLRELLAEDTPLTANVVRALAREGLPQAQLRYGRMLLAGTGFNADAAGAFSIQQTVSQAFNRMRDVPAAMGAMVGPIHAAAS